MYTFDSSVGRAEDCRLSIVILRSLVRIRLEGCSFFAFSFITTLIRHSLFQRATHIDEKNHLNPKIFNIKTTSPSFLWTNVVNKQLATVFWLHSDLKTFCMNHCSRASAASFSCVTRSHSWTGQCRLFRRRFLGCHATLCQTWGWALRDNPPQKDYYSDKAARDKRRVYLPQIN